MKLFIKLIIVAGLLSISQASYAQLKPYEKEAMAKYRAGLYCEAADLLKKASDRTDARTPDSRIKKANYAFKSAECYRLLHDFSSAEQQYKKAILLKYHEEDPIVYYYLGEMQMALGNHKRALSNYRKYDQLAPGDPLTKIRIESCQNYDEFQEEKGRHKMEPMTKLNTSSFDYSAVLDSRGTTMYFTSSRESATGDSKEAITCEDFSDIFQSTIDRKGNFSQPVPVKGTINTIDNEGVPCFDGRGRKMFFTRCVVDDELNLGCDIYMSEKKGSKFSTPVKLDLKDHDSTNVGQPCASPDGNTLIFASNMAGGEGGVDLWMTTYERRTKSWSIPVNLGPEINTAGNDMFPSWGSNDELYYSTDGLVGAGGLDLFVAQKKGERMVWSGPTNLGAPLNTYADDYSIIFTQNDEAGTKGYISSNRAGSKKSKDGYSQDIWSFVVPPIVIKTCIAIIDQDTEEPVSNMEVRILGSDGSSYIMRSDADGMVCLDKKDDGTQYIKQGQTYTIEVPDVEGKWLGNRDKFSTASIGKPTQIIREIAVLDIDKPIRLPEVRYAFGSAELQVNDEVNSKDSLNYLYDLMMDHPTIIIQLMAHTDSRGGADANRKLAQRRAQSCVNYLVNEKGLPKSRLVPKGYGEDVPATYYEVSPSGDSTAFKLTESYINQFKTSDPDKFEMLHQKNRRTEGEILSFDFVKP